MTRHALPLAIALAIAAAFLTVTAGPDRSPPAFGSLAVALALLLAGAALARLAAALARGPSGLHRAGLPAALLAVLWSLLALQDDLAALVRRDRPGPPLAALATTGARAEIALGEDGHFRAEAVVNGVPVRLLVDTGATIVLLSHEDARRVGIDLAGLDWSVPVTTANGPATVAPVTLARVRVGAVELAGVEAAVAEPGKLAASLLGMSFLGALSEAAIRGDRIVLSR